MGRTLMGMETEYAAAEFRLDGTPTGRDIFADLYLGMRRATPAVTDGTACGLYLGNGARFYQDSGHPEYATPECASPRELLVALRAGERLLGAIASSTGIQAERERALFRSNVDYSGTAASWGCHESVFHTCDPAILPPLLIPHFVSRILYTGAGGFITRGRSDFTLSPRAWMLDGAVSSHSTGQRGIFHTKDEPLARSGHHRLHVICGESLCSDVGTLLKVGTTALILAAIDAGNPVGDGLTLWSPIRALRTFAQDTSCSARVRMANGNRTTALELQRHYLAGVRQSLSAGALPDWAGELCELWHETLDHLDRRDGWAERHLDWSTKRLLFEQWVGGAERWAAFEREQTIWARIQRTLQGALEPSPDPPVALDLDALLGERSAAPAVVARLTRYLGAKGASWERMRRHQETLRRLQEIDTRFGQLGDRGIHTQLTQQGLLGTPLIAEDEIERACTHAPTGGRAMVRGLLIRQAHAAGRAEGHSSTWTGVTDHRGHQFADLSDPFVTSVEWQPRSPEQVAQRADLRRMVGELFA